MANLRDISATEVEVNNSICQKIAKYFLRGTGGGRAKGGHSWVNHKGEWGRNKKKKGYLTLSLINLIRISPP